MWRLESGDEESGGERSGSAWWPAPTDGGYAAPRRPVANWSTAQ